MTYEQEQEKNSCVESKEVRKESEPSVRSREAVGRYGDRHVGEREMRGNGSREQGEMKFGSSESEKRLAPMGSGKRTRVCGEVGDLRYGILTLTLAAVCYLLDITCGNTSPFSLSPSSTLLPTTRSPPSLLYQSWIYPPHLPTDIWQSRR